MAHHGVDPKLRGFDTIIFITTYRCNLRCTYCPTHKADEDMTGDVALKAVDRFFEADQLPPFKTVRFFGAEPLLNREIIALVMNDIQRRLPRSMYDKMKFAVTSNGTLLDEPMWDWLDAHPNLELTVSLDGPPSVQEASRISVNGDENSSHWFEDNRERIISRKPPVTVNVTIAPNFAGDLVENVRWLYSKGLRKFNFLPVYYMPWSQEQVATLNSQFTKLARVVSALWEKGLTMVVKNLFVHSETTFFNRALIIDTDGMLFRDNTILTKKVRPVREQLSIGHILDDGPLHEPQQDTRMVIKDIFSPTALRSTAAVDDALSNFVDMLEPAYMHYRLGAKTGE